MGYIETLLLELGSPNYKAGAPHHPIASPDFANNGNMTLDTEGSMDLGRGTLAHVWRRRP